MSRVEAAALGAVLGLAAAAAVAAGASEEIGNLLSRVPDVELVPLPSSGAVTLSIEQSLTIDKLRNVVIDTDPPILTGAVVYPEIMGDGAAQGAEPYIAQGILPFRFDDFRIEWNYAGWHTWEMTDYALRHGFKVGVLYNNRQPADVPIADSAFLLGSGFSWNNWFATHQRPDGQPYAAQRWDLLPPRADLVSQLLAENVFDERAGVTYAMLDLEEPTYPDEEAALRTRPWYPPGGINPGFEDGYYGGFVNMELAAVETAKQQGWPEVGIYGWQPFPRRWIGLESVSVNPATYWPWTRYGREIYRSPQLDVIYPSVYNFYWDERNVAYVLANLDLNLRLVDAEPLRKPVLPYFWNQLHGGGPGWRWWSGQPVRNEDMRAMIAMSFFTGADGLTLWNWSGMNNPHVVTVAACSDYSIAEDFAAVAEMSGSLRSIHRYEAIHVLAVTAASLARFQVIDMAATRASSYGTDRPKTFSSSSPEGYDHRCWQSGDPLVYPVYTMDVASLKALLRPASESIRAVIEGLALVRPVESTLSGGTVKLDVPSQQQFQSASPVIRRVDNAGYSLIISYDPQWQSYPAGRSVVLSDFDGHPGLTLEIPADRHTRLFLLQHE